MTATSLWEEKTGERRKKNDSTDRFSRRISDTFQNNHPSPRPHRKFRFKPQYVREILIFLRPAVKSSAAGTTCNLR